MRVALTSLGSHRLPVSRSCDVNRGNRCWTLPAADGSLGAMTNVATVPSPHPSNVGGAKSTPLTSDPVLTPLTLLVLANAVSLSGNVIMTVAIPWLVLTTTGSAALAGVAVFAGVGGATVGGLAAGRIVDAIGPVRTSAATDLLSGLAVAPLPILLALDALEIWHVVLLAFARHARRLGRLHRAAEPGASGGGFSAGTRASARTRCSPRQSTSATCSALRSLACSSPSFGVGGALWVTVASFGFAALVVRPARQPPALPRHRRDGRRRAGTPRDDRVHLGRPGASRPVRLPDGRR